MSSSHLQYLLDEQGNPYPSDDMKAMSALLVDMDKRRVALDTLEVQGHTLLVSTVFLVINHGHTMEPPVLFETLLFLDEHAIGGSMRRYETREQALRGHAEVMEITRSAIATLSAACVEVEVIDALLRYLDEGEA